MVHEPHHEHLIKELEEQLKPVLTKSPQGVYVYLDDTHKTCNKKFSDMLGYTSPEEWIDNEFPVNDVMEEDQEKVINAYMDASENFKASAVETKLKRKDGKEIRAEAIMVPIVYKGETFVLHFISFK